ncbi:flagellar hook-associated protein FlgL [Vreelandella jeotgali]|uniref:flagellar hook-associated protein FlgL n=1 Tax=Vreelandella jeotgali TaxID=553386 RepID=UPI00034699B7|nr:flagellar hook-associated protein FlgL [Halomonas jeotgali]
MRISSVTMYEQSAASINRQQAEFMKINEQMASGRRVVNPSDDPQDASRAVGVDQSKAVTQQYADARVSARNSLSQTESILNSVSDSVTSAKTLLIQASSDTLSDVDRESIASDMKGIYETMLGQANATDGTGRYLFGGYADDAPPFSKNANGNVEYNGDSSAREQRIDASREMPVTENGESIFQSVPSSAGYVAETPRDDDNKPVNTGTVTFSGPQVTDVNADSHGDDFEIRFSESSGGDTKVTVVNLTDNSTPVDEEDYEGNQEGGQRLEFGGLSITLEGEPKLGGTNDTKSEPDKITVAQAGSEEHPANLFGTMEKAIAALDSPNEDKSDEAAFHNTMKTSMRDLDNALDNALTVRASAGARLNELDVVDGVGANRMQNYDKTLSDLVDLDFVDAISEYSLRQVGMQASQQAFANIKGSSLFDYLR